MENNEMIVQQVQQKSNKGIIILLVLIIIILLGISGYLAYDKFIAKDTTPAINNNSVQSNNNIINNTEKNNFSVDFIEEKIKNALMTMVKNNEGISIGKSANSIYAEGHKTLRTEIKDNKLYAYVTAEIGTYELKDGKVECDSAVASPYVIIFDINNSDLIYSSYKMPDDGNTWMSSLKEIFPSDLVDQAANVDYRVDFYQSQIKSYMIK